MATLGSFVSLPPLQPLPLRRRFSSTATRTRFGGFNGTFLQCSSLQTPNSSGMLADNPPAPPSLDAAAADVVLPSASVKELSTRACQACGRDEIEKGCNGEGRIQGGIATVPGFGWWPMKAYRPCPGFVASGGTYRRRGQSMDELAFGKGE